jgi:hypothetical protein
VCLPLHPAEAYLFLVRIGVVKFWFWFLWAMDAVMPAVALHFFFSLAAGGRIGSFNIAVAGDPCRFGSCNGRERLVALDRATRCCDCSSPGVSNSRSFVRGAFPSAVDSASKFSLSGRDVFDVDFSWVML